MLSGQLIQCGLSHPDNILTIPHIDSLSGQVIRLINKAEYSGGARLMYE